MVGACERLLGGQSGGDRRSRRCVPPETRRNAGSAHACLMDQYRLTDGCAGLAPLDRIWQRTLSPCRDRRGVFVRLPFEALVSPDRAHGFGLPVLLPATAAARDHRTRKSDSTSIPTMAPPRRSCCRFLQQCASDRRWQRISDAALDGWQHVHGSCMPNADDAVTHLRSGVRQQPEREEAAATCSCSTPAIRPLALAVGGH